MRDRNRKETEATSKSRRVEEETVLLSGRKPLVELLRHKPERILELYVAQSATFDRELSGFIEAAVISCRSKTFCAAEFEALVGREIHHQGICARVRPQAAVSLAEASALGLARQLPLVLAEQLSDPQNLGALFRGAEALGCACLLLTRDRSSAVTPVVRRVSAGATEFLPFCYLANVQRALKELKQAGYWIIGTALGEGSKALYECDLPCPSVVVLGSEGRGLRELTKRSCDVLVEIPLCGITQSLNVATAGSVVLSEIARRRSAACRET